MAKCGQCEFKGSSEEYESHTCVSGFTPTDPRNLGKRFLAQSKNALKRTGSLSEEKENEINGAIEDVRAKEREGQ